jgi:DNA invertase Pin-like site-specific DNA recombinase
MAIGTEHIMTKRAALYLRVSTGEQSTEMQRTELEAVASRAGWEIIQIYQDAGISGRKGRDERPAFDRMLKDAALRRFDILAVWSTDRLGRSLKDLVVTLSELHASGVDLFLQKQAVDTSTPTGRALFGMLDIFSEFERDMIVERVRSGVARARANGKRLGRPPVGQGKKDYRPGLANAVLAELAQGTSLRATAKRCDVSLKTVQRIKAAGCS